MKKLLATLALAAMLTLPASAAVRFGVSIGVPYGPPVYSTYCGPYGCSYPGAYYYGGYYYGRGYAYYDHGHRYYRHPRYRYYRR